MPNLERRAASAAGDEFNSQRISSEATARTERIEETRGRMGQLLGTAGQVEGYGADERFAEYGQRYEIDAGMLKGTEQLLHVDDLHGGDMQRFLGAYESRLGNIEHRYGTSSRGKETAIRWSDGGSFAKRFFEDVSEDANALLDEAEGLAQQGDWEGAAALKAQAAKLSGGAWAGQGFESGVLSLTGGNVEAAARAGLSGTMATTVGSMVQQGRGFMDRESKTSRDFKTALGSGARREIEMGRVKQQRSLAIGAREAKRGVRDLALSRGGGRNFAFERAATERFAERQGTALANVELEASRNLSEISGNIDRYFEEFSRKFSAGSVEVGQAFLDNSAGIRDEFVRSLNALSMGALDFGNSMATRSHEKWLSEQQAAAAASGGGIGSIVGGLVGSFLGPLGTAVGSAAGGLFSGGSSFSSEAGALTASDPFGSF